MKPKVNISRGSGVRLETAATIRLILALWLCGLASAVFGQGFQNLDFESASVTLPGPGQTSFNAALPGWTGYCGSNVQTSVNYDQEWLDTAGISILDANCTIEPVGAVIHGRYCVSIYSGFQGPPPLLEFDVPSSIAQTGIVPSDTLSLLFNFSSSQNWGTWGVNVTFNGNPIAMAVVEGGSNSVVLGGDVSQFAGQVGELRFAAPTDTRGYHSRSGFLMDYIRFSSSPPPLLVPTIRTSLQSQTARLGSTADFAVDAIGGLPLAYQWFFNGTNAISGATTPDLHLSNLQPSQSGAYSVVVNNAFGSVTSSPALLTLVALAPVILAPPQNQTADLGSTVQFTVTADGAPPPAYQWFFEGTNALDGATNSVLILTDVQLSLSGSYTVVVTNAVGAITSAPAVLNVVAFPPTILTAPRTQTAIAGRFADFTSLVGGSPPLVFQWSFNSSAIPGATNAELYLTHVQPSDAGTYAVQITNAFGAVTSPPAALMVVAAPYLPSGTVVAWGDNRRGESVVPEGLSNIIAIAAGWEHSLAIKSDRTVVDWGNSDTTNVPAHLTDIVAIAGGGAHSLALKSDGTVVAWGNNAYGQCTMPAGLQGVVAIAAGFNHSLALKSDGTVAAWGANYAGQCRVPEGLRDVIAVAARVDHSLALKSDGTVVAWEPDDVPAGLQEVIAVAGGSQHSLALTSDGTITGWGAASVPAGLNGVEAIAAGYASSLALMSNGTVVAWDDNVLQDDSYGQTNVPPGLHNVIAVASSLYHDLALVAEPPGVMVLPSSQTAETGSTISFRANPVDTMFSRYQWFFNGTNAVTPVTTDWMLLLTNVQPPQAGVYTVVASGANGAVTSAPTLLSVIAPVARITVPALTMVGQPGNSLNLQDAEAAGPASVWVPLDIVMLTNSSQLYFDLSAPAPSTRFYRAGQSGQSGSPPGLAIHKVPAITLTGTIGSSVRLDYINQFGPTDAWVTLATVQLTNPPQLYFDVSSIGQPSRLWRMVPVP